VELFLPLLLYPFLILDHVQIFDEDISVSSLLRLSFMSGHKVFNEQVCHDYLRDSLQFSNDGDLDVPKAHVFTIEVHSINSKPDLMVITLLN
jgi:hypothetical protein